MKTISVEICMGSSCHLMGALDLFDAVEALPAGVRDRIELSEVVCLKSCRQGPSVRINGIVLSGMTPDLLVEIINDNLVQQGEKRYAASQSG